MKTNWTLFSNSQEIAKAAAEHILFNAEQAIANKGNFHIALAGGTTPRQTYEILSQSKANWNKWFLYIGDERCLPPNDPERNSLMIQQTLLDKLPIPNEQFFPIPSEVGAETAAESYTKILPDALDFVLLGMGEDGHTASLFPHHPCPSNKTAFAEHNSPKPPADRVSLTYSYISQAQQRLILVSGKGKNAAVSDWINGKDLPVAWVERGGMTQVYLDTGALGENLG